MIVAGCGIGSMKIGIFSIGQVEGRRHLAR